MREMDPVDSLGPYTPADEIYTVPITLRKACPLICKVVTNNVLPFKASAAGHHRRVVSLGGLTLSRSLVPN